MKKIYIVARYGITIKEFNTRDEKNFSNKMNKMYGENCWFDSIDKLKKHFGTRQDVFNIKIKKLYEMENELIPKMFEQGEVTLAHKNKVGVISKCMFDMLGKCFIGIENINPDTYDVEHVSNGKTYNIYIRDWMCSGIEKIT